MGITKNNHNWNYMTSGQWRQDGGVEGCEHTSSYKNTKIITAEQ